MHKISVAYYKQYKEVSSKIKMRFLFLLVVIRLWDCTHSLTARVYGVISKDMGFVHKEFPVPPSKRAIIEFGFGYTVFDGSIEPLFMIYTTQDHVNIEKRCFDKPYGQLANQNLYHVLQKETSVSRPMMCDRKRKNDYLYRWRVICNGKITIQDCTPRKFSFSFGHSCSFKYRSFNDISYGFTIHVTNETSCYKLIPGNACYPYMHFGAFPNLLGEGRAFTYFERASSCFERFPRALFPHILKFICNFFTVKCDRESNEIIPPCQEMCHEYLDHCYAGSGESGESGESFDCNYLPSLNGDFPCFYESMGCSEPPPFVKNAKVTTKLINRDKYFIPNVVEYSCDEGFKMVGNKTISCTYDGRWSIPPQCSLEHEYISNSSEDVTEAEFIVDSTGSSTNKSTLHFLVVMSLLVLVVILLVIVAGRYKIKLEQKRVRDLAGKQEGREDPKMSPEVCTSPLKRTRPFDATLFYHFDTDDSFVINHLLPELEENRNFKLCIHSRNFTPGRDIKDNIKEAIETSNSAIIVMSQGFVDSMWCKEEFTHCYIENMKDAAFNVFVIMMLPPDTLVNISNYIKTFFDTKTYLDVNDPQLFPKLASHLKNARHHDDDGDDDDDDDDNVEKQNESQKTEEIIWFHNNSRNEETLVMQETSI